jgi:hypothetical protein
MDLIDVEDEFESCLALQEAAAESCGQFIALLLAEYGATKLQYVVDNDWHPGWMVWRFSTTARPSIKLRKLAYNVLSDCRHALDQAVVASSRCLGTDRKKSKIYFPFAKDEADFDSLYDLKNGRCRDTAQALIPELKSLRPWWGGDNQLRTLGKLSGPNKHQVIIDFAPEIMNFYSGRAKFGSAALIAMAPRRADLINPDDIGGLSMKSPRGRTDFILAITRQNDGTEVTGVGGTAAYCAKEASVLHNPPIDKLMAGFAAMTEKIIAGLKGFVIKQVIT